MTEKEILEIVKANKIDEEKFKQYFKCFFKKELTLEEILDLSLE